MNAPIAAALSLLAAAPAAAPDISSLNIEALKALPLDQVQWKPADGLGGTDTAVLVGDPAKPGLYVVLNRFHPGAHSRPHYHPNNRYIMVVKGPWYVSTGLADDIERTGVALPQGSFVTHTGREVHYDGAKAGGGEAIVMIFGEGPGTRIDCVGPNAEKGPGPCADALAKARRP